MHTEKAKNQRTNKDIITKHTKTEKSQNLRKVKKSQFFQIFEFSRPKWPRLEDVDYFLAKIRILFLIRFIKNPFSNTVYHGCQIEKL